MGNKLYVGNLSSDTTEEELEAFFSSYGKVLSVKIKRDNVTGEPWGYGFIEMADPGAAEQALLDGKGRLLGNKKLSIDAMRIP